MKKIILLRGLPGSGKSTWSKEQVANNPGQFKRVNKDDLRLLIDCGKYSKSNEAMILNVRDSIIRDSLSRGVSIIVDDTNFESIHEERLRLIAKEFNAGFEVKFFDTPLDICIERDSQRENPIGKDVIMNMYNRYFKKSFVERKKDESLPNCIIVDIDGTLAIKGDRDIYDGSKVYLDTVVEQVKYLTNLVYYDLEMDGKVFIFSGRDGEYFDVTLNWLRNNGVEFNQLVLRNPGDKRDDTIVKKEMYEKHIEGKYNVLFCIDDRKKVVDKWRELGIFTFDVNQNRDEF